jgi:regulator of replication initiation timing
MINRIFFISDSVFQAGETLPEDDNIYFSLLVNPSVKESLENVYHFMGDIKLSRFALTLDIQELPSEESIRFVTSFLFLPSYLSIERQPVINLSGNSQELLTKTASGLSNYLLLQGTNNVIINNIFTLADQPAANTNYLFYSSDELLRHYKEVLQSDQYYNNTVFFYVSSIEALRSTLLSLQQEENEFKQNSPKLYSLINDNRMFEKEIGRLRRKLAYTETELSHQKQYSDILRSDHSTKELQNYYDHEYEILPAWYKRFGHVLKVITGKRTFRSLFREDVKKYKE